MSVLNLDDHDDGECWNCCGEGYVCGCGWDWQCPTYDLGEQSCLCTRRCNICNPAPRDPALIKALSDALATQSTAAEEKDRG